MNSKLSGHKLLNSVDFEQKLIECKFTKILLSGLLLHVLLTYLLLLLLVRTLGLYNYYIRQSSSSSSAVQLCKSPCLPFGFRNSNFYGVRLSAPRPTPNLEDQGISFSLGHHRQGRPCQ
jgi:hypothetical protein